LYGNAFVKAFERSGNIDLTVLFGMIVACFDFIQSNDSTPNCPKAIMNMKLGNSDHMILLLACEYYI
jgi:hypothetical protein